MSWRPSSGVEPLAEPLPSHTEAVLVAVVTPNAPFRHLIFVFPLFWQLPGNRQLDLPVDCNLCLISLKFKSDFYCLVRAGRLIVSDYLKIN